MSYVHGSVIPVEARRGPSEVLELEFQVVFSCPTLVLGTVLILCRSSKYS